MDGVGRTVEAKSITLVLPAEVDPLEVKLALQLGQASQAAMFASLLIRETPLPDGTFEASRFGLTHLIGKRVAFHSTLSLRNSLNPLQPFDVYVAEIDPPPSLSPSGAADRKERETVMVRKGTVVKFSFKVEPSSSSTIGSSSSLQRFESLLAQYPTTPSRNRGERLRTLIGQQLRAMEGSAEVDLSWRPTKGVLFVGPSGSGKTYLIDQLAKAFPVEYVSLSIILAASGPTTPAHTIRSLFDRACARRSILVLDDCSVLSAGAVNDSNSIYSRERSVTLRTLIVELCSIFDSLEADRDFAAEIAEYNLRCPQSTGAAGSSRRSEPLSIIALSTSLDLYPLLLSPSRFGELIQFALPNAEERHIILRTRFEANLSPEGHQLLIDRTKGWCIGDLLARPLPVTEDKVRDGMEGTDTGKSVGARAEHTIGFVQHVDALQRLFFEPLRNVELLRSHGLVCPKGALITGPTATGKTHLLRMIECRLRQECPGVSMYTVDAHSLIVKEVGESEKKISALFELARSTSPSAIVLDNLEAIAARRGANVSETNTAGDRVLSTLLTEMDGLRAQRSTVVVFAAAPSLDPLDPAVYRSGRLDYHIDLGYPTATDLKELFLLILSPFRKMVIDSLPVADSSSPPQDGEAYWAANDQLQLVTQLLETLAGAVIKPGMSYADAKVAARDVVIQYARAAPKDENRKDDDEVERLIHFLQERTGHRI
jgi:SpoVK/Ycf46/Vps4 family AAA+-type ATPase